jgi:glycosyltransferase involved in cell wall biosynthesis
VNTVHVVVPAGIDDRNRPSGGNTYDRRLCSELAATGWDVREHAAPGSWPWPDLCAQQSLARMIDGIADGQLLLVDGLIASMAPAILVPAARRLTLVVLIHLPLGYAFEGPDAGARERAVLSAARAVVTTSSWTRDWLLRHYALRPNQVYVVEPGTDSAGLAPGTTDGGELICVGAITPDKGYDLLLTSLASIADLSWHCICVGTLDRDPVFVEGLRRRIVDDGIGDRVHFSGHRTAQELDQMYGAADALVHASRGETYGMVITEALARGLPIVATDVGGVPEALGRVTGGRRPGLLVPPGDPQALVVALRRWLLDATLRQQLRTAALERRTTLPRWGGTADRIARVLTEAAG